ncbi:MAG: hypothetical protein QOK38_417 [Acidobacteriaceae bacterium]|jgi:hypothetical protein|nr:hypothetical protein [Acidobacteriaceae bacterium]
MAAMATKQAGIMKSLFEASTLEEVAERMARLRSESERLWGKMTAAQMLAHCAATMEMAVGLTFPPRRFVGRLVGPLAKKAVVTEGKPFHRNSPSDKSLIIREDRDFDRERQRLLGLLERFAAGGPAGCTKHPHSFFGRLTPAEWAALMYHHLDHHLQQFGV